MSTRQHNKKFYPWLVVALLWVVALLNYMDRQMLSTMQDAMKLDIVELQKAEAFGALMAVFLWIYGLVSPFAGVVADRVSRKKLMLVSMNSPFSPTVSSKHLNSGWMKYFFNFSIDSSIC
jgi:sugar phosphate permease